MGHQPSTSMAIMDQLPSVAAMDQQTPSSRALAVQQICTDISVGLATVTPAITPDLVQPLPKAGI